MELLTILASLLVTGSALLLIKRGANRRLKLLALTVGLMSLTQIVVLLQATRHSRSRIVEAYQLLVASLSLTAVYLLGLEIRDRRRADRQLRLLEQDLPYASMRTLSSNIGFPQSQAISLAGANPQTDADGNFQDGEISKEDDQLCDRTR